jgi:hypothetical protein
VAVRVSLFRLRRRGRAGPAEAPAEEALPAVASAPAPARRPLPPAGRLRRERRALLRIREDRLRDLGGLVLEMYRRDDFRPELVDERCAELAGVDERLYELDALLRAATGKRRPAARCACGTPIMWGSRFCASCGRPVGGPQGIACETCGAALQADAQFCPSCGAGVGPTTEPEPGNGRAAAAPVEDGR